MKIKEETHRYICFIIIILYFLIDIRYRIFCKSLFILSFIQFIIGIIRFPNKIHIIIISYIFGYYFILENNPIILSITIYFPFRKLLRCLLYYLLISYATSSDEEKKESYFTKFYLYFRVHGYQLLFLFLILILIRIFIALYEEFFFIYFYPKSYFIDKEEKYYICANIFNNEKILPNWIKQMKKLISYLGIKNVYISIFENGDSSDRSAEYLNKFRDYLNNKKIPNKIVTTHVVEKKGKKRIEFLSEIRNKALEFLYELPNINYNKTRILFLNDIIYNYQDVIKLIATNGRDYDVACPLDYIFCFYDIWVSIDTNGYHFHNQYPYVFDKISRDIIVNEEVMRVFSCWNGMVSMRALPFKDKNITFRNSSRIDSSECTLMNTDLYLNGYQKILLNSKIKVAYEDYWYYITKYSYPRTRNLEEYFTYYYFTRWNYSNLYFSEDLKTKNYPLSPQLERFFHTHFLKNETIFTNKTINKK